MTTTILTWDEGYEQRELPSPSAAEVQSRIAALNGVNRTLVTVYRDESHIAVGGSASDGLVVYCTFDNEVFWQLLSNATPGGSIDVVAGSQAGTYPSEHVTTLAAAQKAAAVFLEHGDRAPMLRWKAQ